MLFLGKKLIYPLTSDRCPNHSFKELPNKK